jgi:crotonobetainyl-CoA:carnitine CoA-transferase CaiB-like acyl-CoA transferase
MQAFAGHLSNTGEQGRPSVRSGPSSIDLLTGAHAAFGVMLALRHRDRTGEGQAIDVSLFDSAVYLVCNHLTDYTATGQNPGKFGSHFPLLAPYGVFSAQDREFYLGISSDVMWRRFCEAALPELSADPRFQTNADRLSNRAALHGELFPLFRRRDARYWVDIAVELGIPVTLVQNLGELVAHEQTKARHLLVDAGVDGIQSVGVPLKLSATPGRVRRPAPRLGEDTARVLDGLRDVAGRPRGR